MWKNALLLCDFKILLTAFNQSYNCQTSHNVGRNRLPKPFLILPSLVQTQSGSHQFSANIAGAEAISSIMAILEMAKISIYKRDFVLPFYKENVFFFLDNCIECLYPKLGLFEFLGASNYWWKTVPFASFLITF